MSEKTWRLELNEKDREPLAAAALEQKRSMVDVVRRWLNIGLAVDEARKRGAKVIFREADGSESVVLFL